MIEHLIHPKTAEALATHLRDHFEAMGNNEPFPRITTEQPRVAFSAGSAPRPKATMRIMVNGRGYTVTVTAHELEGGAA